MSKIRFDSQHEVSERRSIPRDRPILVLGPFPSPVHGFSQATMEIANLFETAGYAVSRIDLKPVRGSMGLWSSLQVRLRQVAKVMAQLLRGADLYLALSGGRRQAVDILFLLIGRICGARLFVHHHSFAYLTRRSSLASFCFKVCGSSATHLVLCSTMGVALRRHYGVVQRTQVLSNAVLMGEGSPFRQRTAVETLGFLGALTADKGILEFLQVVGRLTEEYPDLQFRIAGPCSDDKIRQRVSSACENNSRLRYVGAVYGEAKKEFLESIDVLLFPSTYRNEAEPFVIWEAQASGIPVIASERGCMEEMMRLQSHQPLLVRRNQSFVEMTLKTILGWLSDPRSYARRSAEVNLKFQTASIDARRRFEKVFCQQPETVDVSAENRFRPARLIRIEPYVVDPAISHPPELREC